MSLTELFEKQEKELQQFKAARDAAWSNMKQEHQNLASAFGGEANMPPAYKKRMEQQINNYHKEWSMEGGSRHKELLEQHAKQRQAITGKKSDTPAQAKKQEQDMMTKKQQDMQKIIARQQAIKKAAQEKQKKRGR